MGENGDGAGPQDALQPSSTGEDSGSVSIFSTPKLIAISIVLLAIWVAFAYFDVRSAAFDAQGITADGDSIVVLGAAQYEGEPSPVLERRLLTALELFEDEAAPQVVTTGANQPGDTFTEGFAAYQYLRNAGVADEQILVVVDGGNTYESLLATANQLDEDEREVIIVTDAYHAQRSADIAAEVGLDATVVAAGSDTSADQLFRETVAVSAGRLISYRRLSNWLNAAEGASDDSGDPADEATEESDDNSVEDPSESSPGS